LRDFVFFEITFLFDRKIDFAFKEQICHQTKGKARKIQKNSQNNAISKT
jgi:hypothetical protein